MRTLPALLAAFLLLSASEGGAAMYRWTDRSGNVNFTNDLNKVPAEHRDSARAVEESGDRVRVDASAPAAPAPERRSSSKRAAERASEHLDRNGRGEEWWRKRAENLRRELRDLQDEHDLLAKKERELDEKERSTSAKKKKSRAGIESKKEQVEKKMKQVRRRLEVDLPEEARRADAYPGWIRE